MPTLAPEELPTLETADLARVTGGAGDDLSSMLPMVMMMMMRGRAEPTAAPAPPAIVPAWKPKITVDGVEQPVATSASGTTFTVSS